MYKAGSNASPGKGYADYFHDGADDNCGLTGKQ
jgi:hypothetical protein